MEQTLTIQQPDRTEPADAISLPGAAQIRRIVQVASVDRRGSAQRVCCSDLSKLTASELTAIEQSLAARYGYGERELLWYAGRNSFLALPAERVERLRKERELDDLVNAELRSTERRLPKNAVLFSVAPALGKRVAAMLGIEPDELTLERFANSETRAAIHESVRGKHAFVLATLSEPVNEGLIDTALLVQALKLSDASAVSVILPYFAYGRQDRQPDDAPRSPISARMVTDLLGAMGADRIVTVDVHAKQVAGFFQSGAFDNLSGLSQLITPLLRGEGADLIVVSPDEGGSKRASAFGRLIERESGRFSPLVIMSKFRRGPGIKPEVRLTADPALLAGKTCVLVDDMLDTGGTIAVAAQALKAQGAARVVICATHAVCSQDAISRLEALRGPQGERVIDRIYVTDTLPVHEPRSDFFNVISVAPLISDVIRRLSSPGRSLSELRERSDLGYQLPSLPALLH